MKWENKTINDLCEIKGGKRLPKNHELIEIETNHPYIRARDIGNGIINFSKPVFLQESTFNFISRYIVKEDDIVLTIVGANIGDVGLIPKELDGANLTENAVKLTSFNANCHFKYLLYYFLLPGKKKQLEQVAAGSAQGKLGLYKIKDIEVPIPPLPTQRKIASILSAYDDLIENNLKRIKLLEEKAEIVYKTEFDFFKPSNEINKLPIGWKVQRADEIFRINIGKTPPREQQEWFNDIDSGVKWVSIKDINNSTVFLLNTSETVTENAVNKFNMNVAKSDTVILSFKLTVGKVAITTEEMVTNEAIAHFNIDDETKMNSEFIYFYLKNFPYDSLGSTSSIGTAINSKIVKAMPVLLPSEKVIEDFGKNVKPAFQLIKTLLKQNSKLREARDILLPKLMNGQIEV